MRRLPALAVLTTALLLPLSGVAFADAEVTINDDGVSPETVRADIREPIVWTNASDADVSLVGSDPKWESGPIEPGATFSIEITRKGFYNYASADGELSGRIVVGQVNAGTDDDDSDSDAKGDDKAKGDGADKKIDPDKEALPKTGIDATIPAALSVTLIGLGTGLLTVTHPPRRRRKA